MAKAAYDVLGAAITGGAVITKYDHVKGPIGALELFEAGHPVPDENSYRATSRALELVSGLSERDTVLFLLSGGGSALFESPLVPAEEMADVTKQLLACGADIVEMNTLRKRLSAVKGGRFAERCLPAKGLLHRAVRHSGRSAGYDRLRPGLSRFVDLRTGAGGGAKIRPAAL